MTLNRKILTLASAIALTLSAHSETLLKGQCFDHTFSYYEYRFDIDNRELAQLPEGSTVRMISSFEGTGSVNSSGHSGPFHDYEPAAVLMEKTGKPGEPLLHSQRQVFYMATGGYLSHLNFYFEMTTPDGQTSFLPAKEADAHGQLQQPYFQSEFFRPDEEECWHLKDGVTLPLVIRRPETGSAFHCEDVGARSETWTVESSPLAVCRMDSAVIEEHTLAKAVQNHDRALAVKAFLGDYTPAPPGEPPTNYLPNPAFEMCKGAGGVVTEVRNQEGYAEKLCYFVDGSVIDVWAIYMGPEEQLWSRLADVIKSH